MKTKFVLPTDGMRGFDANTTITAKAAALFKSRGYQFVVRYVRRHSFNSYDITNVEMQTILGSGLGLMLVQHVAPENWEPTGILGIEYGATAGAEAKKIGYPAGGVIWCDLEGVDHNVPAQNVIDFCNNWFNQVTLAGYAPGLYVGYAAGLTGDQLYRKLRFSRYWSAYNLNADLFPAVRGVQMKQGAYPGEGAVPGIPYQFDIDIARADKLGGRVKLLMIDASTETPPAPKKSVWNSIKARIGL